MSDVLVAAFCESGPYRHVVRTLEVAPDAWLPWGYRTRQVRVGLIEGLDLSQRKIELWSVDDTRAPSAVRFVGGGAIDFFVSTDDYLAFTIRCMAGALPVTGPEDVLQGVTAGVLLFDPNLSLVGHDSEERNGAVPERAAIPEDVASLPLG